MPRNAPDRPGEPGERWEIEWNETYTGQGEADFEAADEQLLKMIDGLAPGRALDLGCGAGGLAIELARRGWKVTGVDLAENAIQSARENAVKCGVEVDFAVRDIRTWKPEGEYDLVTSSFALPETAGARRKAIARAVAALAPGGTLLLAEWEGSTIDAEAFGDGQTWASLDEVVPAIDGLEIERAEITEHAPHDHSRGEDEHGCVLRGQDHGRREEDRECAHEHGHPRGDWGDWKAFYVRARRALNA